MHFRKGRNCWALDLQNLSGFLKTLNQSIGLRAVGLSELSVYTVTLFKNILYEFCLIHLWNLPICFLAVLEEKARQNTTILFDAVSGLQMATPLCTLALVPLGSYKDSIRLNEHPLWQPWWTKYLIKGSVIFWDSEHQVPQLINLGDTISLCKPEWDRFHF